MKRVLGGLGLGLALVFLSTATAQAAPSAIGQDSPGSSPGANSGLGGVGDLVGGLAGGAGTLGFLLPSPNGSGANFVNGLMNNPAGAITGTPDSILPYGLLDGGKPQPLPSK
ncbi:hypothetical protein CU254_00330 [Amycolatopsis sp. AA4]|uniref:hypothetical protein n=1 Tax=Actinomycetes TaxID=1760 RepID=UPI0001B554DC|nr:MULTISPECIES: hypothetical protein [Actinomycetes]ATY09104.1 hypothetical protein CU254_00330 [Amycolatopsis sp. AA4]